MIRHPRERFDEKVAWAGLEDCWLWRGTLVHGYGYFSLHGKSVRAHRLAYEWFVGPIPEGLTIDHLCCTKECVNPTHMEPVTQGENARRANVGKPGRRGYTKVRCLRGHILEGNVYVNPQGVRHCRTCKRIRNLEYKARRRAREAAANE